MKNLPVSSARLMKLGRFGALGFAVAAVLWAGASSALAQTPVVVTASVGSVLSMTVDNATVTFAFVQSDYAVDTGLALKSLVAATTFRVTTNQNWQLMVKAATAAFTFVPTGTTADPVKPIGDLSVRPASGTYSPVTATAKSIATGSRGGSGRAGNTIPIDYQLASSLASDPPGTYTLTLTYTLLAVQ